MKLEDIGFYTLNDRRARTASEFTDLQRCELILTDRCNFSCPYCRGLRSEISGDLPYYKAVETLTFWIDEGLQNVRFSGGEPLLYKGLEELVQLCADNSVKRIAVSSNGSLEIKRYLRLIDAGVNDFSISLDACCAADGDAIAGGRKGSWNKVVNNITELSKLTYVSVGMVFTEANIDSCVDSVLFAHSLGVSDIRVIPSAQFNQALTRLGKALPDKVLDKYPILKYRIQNIRKGRHVRGIQETDCTHCPLALDDMVVAAGYHFPCVIYMREGGYPIGEIGDPDLRHKRMLFSEYHNTHHSRICRENCLDVCIDYNNKWEKFHKI